MAQNGTIVIYQLLIHLAYTIGNVIEGVSIHLDSIGSRQGKIYTSQREITSQSLFA